MSVYTTSYAGDPTGGAANQSYGVAAGATGVMPTPADSVEEFKVNVAGQGADFNSSAGAQVIIQTKSGTDQWHGTAYRVLPRQQPERKHLGEQLHRNPELQLPLQPFRRRHRRTDHFRRRSWAARPTSLPTTKASVSRTRRPIERAVPSAAMRLGLLTFGGTTYNLNPTPVTYQRRHLPAGAVLRVQGRAIRVVSASIRWCSRCGTSTCRCRTKADAV